MTPATRESAFYNCAYFFLIFSQKSDSHLLRAGLQRGGSSLEAG